MINLLNISKNQPLVQSSYRTVEFEIAPTRNTKIQFVGDCTWKDTFELRFVNKY